MKFRKKPVVIEAVKWTGGNLEEIHMLMNGRTIEWGPASDSTYALYIKTIEGEMRADQGDWIIKGVKGEFYPCKPDIFAVTYEAYE